MRRSIARLLTRSLQPRRRSPIVRLRVEPMEARVNPAWAVSLAGTVPSFIGDANSDSLSLYNDSGFLAHNSGDPSLESARDLSHSPGVQEILIASITNLIVDGNGGDDVVSLDNIAAPATIEVSLMYWYGSAQPNVSATLTSNAFTVTGGPAYLYGLTGLTGAAFYFGTGDNSFNGSAVNYKVDAYMGDGNDTVIGGSVGDTLSGEGGNDVVIGNGGLNYLYGGAGNDTITGGSADDTIFGEGGADQVDGGAGTDSFHSIGISSLIVTNSSLIVNGGTPGANNFESISVFGTTGHDNYDASAWTAGTVYFESYEGNDTLRGGSGNDAIYAYAGNDYLEGNGGSDTLYGYEGHDTILGGDGDDFLHSNGGQDLLDGGPGTFDRFVANGTPLLVVTDVGVSVDGGPVGAGNLEYFELYDSGGPDFWDASGWTGGYVSFSADLGNDTLRGGSGNDYLYGGTDHDLLEGFGGNDILYGYAGNDTLRGGDGDDSLQSNGGQDLLDGGPGTFDRFVADGTPLIVITDAGVTVNGGPTGPGNFEYFEMYDSGAADFWDASAWTGGYVYFNSYLGNDTLRGGSGNDSIYGGPDDDILEGHGGNDNLFGHDGNDTLRGGDGNDYCQSNGGQDVAEGGTGNDSYVADNTPQLLVTDAGLIVNGGPAGANQFEYFEMYPTISDDHWDASAWTGGYVYFNGGEGNDTLLGGSGNDTIYTGVGNDTASAGDGNDTIHGQSGADVVDGGLGNDNFYSSDINTFFATNASVSINGGAAGLNRIEYFELYGTPNADNIDLSNWGGGYCYIYSYAGNDTLRGGSGNDSLNALEGDDLLFGGDGNDALNGGADDDQLFGGAGGDSLSGEGGNDLIEGGGDNDYISAGTGNDTLRDGPEINYLYGEEGTDSLLITGTNAADQLSLSDNIITFDGVSQYFYTIESLALDTLGGVDEGTQVNPVIPALYTVAGLEPTVNSGPDETSIALPFLRTGTFKDIGFGQSWTGMVDYGEGDGFVPMSPQNIDQVNKTFSLSHNYSAGGLFIVRVRIIDNQGNVGEDSFEIRRPAGIQVGVTGGNQRSMVEELVVSFDQIQTLNPGWYTFERLSPGPVPTIVPTIVNTGGQTFATLNFSGDGLDPGNSLQDGNYKLTLNSAFILNGSNEPFDGDGDGNPGGAYIFGFHRFFGDANGDRTVDGVDFVQFGAQFGLSSTQPGFTTAFDYQRDNNIDATDFAQFGNRFGRTLA